MAGVMNAFYYDNELYIRAVPAKSLFNSTLVHQVVNRGDVFALRVRDQALTIVPGKAAVTHVTMDITVPLRQVMTPVQASFME